MGGKQLWIILANGFIRGIAERKVCVKFEKIGKQMRL